jgi:hypothetical protein
MTLQAPFGRPAACGPAHAGRGRTAQPGAPTFPRGRMSKRAALRRRVGEGPKQCSTAAEVTPVPASCRPGRDCDRWSPRHDPTGRPVGGPSEGRSRASGSVRAAGVAGPGLPYEAALSETFSVRRQTSLTLIASRH